MEEFTPVPDIDDLLLGALEPDDLPDDQILGQDLPLREETAAFVRTVRRAVMVEEGRLRPRAKLEVSFLGALCRVEAKLTRADGTSRVVRAPTLAMCLAVLNDVEDDGQEMELDVGGVWTCPDCHGLQLKFKAGESGGQGELGLCPRCAGDRDEDLDDDGDEPQPPQHD